jgi:hypothetical protein
MRDEQEFPDWTQDQDDRLRAALGSLRHDVDAAGIPDVRFVMRRATRQRHRAVVGIAAGAAAVLGLSWFGLQALDETPSTAPADNGTVTTERDQAPTTEQPTEQPPPDSTDPAPVDRVDLFTSAASVPDLSLFVPPGLWSSETFTDGAATESALGETEGTALFDCDPDDVMWGAADEGTFGIMGVWSEGRAFGTQRVRVLDSPDAASGYVDDLNAALSDCEAPAEADNIALDVQPLERSGAYRITTEFRDGTESMTDFVYVVQHDGTPEAVSTFRLVDWSREATDAEAVEELERLGGLATDD